MPSPTRTGNLEKTSSERPLAELLKAASQGLLVVGQDGRVRDANVAALDLLRLPGEEVLGYPLASLVSGTPGDWLSRALVSQVPPGEVDLVSSRRPISLTVCANLLGNDSLVVMDGRDGDGQPDPKDDGWRLFAPADGLMLLRAVPPDFEALYCCPRTAALLGRGEARALEGQPGAGLMDLVRRADKRAMPQVLEVAGLGGGRIRAMALPLARGAALSLRDLSDGRQAQWALQFLVEMAPSFASALETERVTEPLARALVPALADWCAVFVRDESGEAVLRSATCVDPAEVDGVIALCRSAAQGKALGRGLGISQVLVDGRPYLMPELGTNARVAAFGGLWPKSVMTVALEARERALGVVCLAITESGRRFSEPDLLFAEEVARRAAVALDNARLLRQAQRERQRAEAANRAKDEFLAVVSHELRTPLTAILSWTRLLRREALTPERRERALETIERNAKTQAQLVNDLLDVSRIVVGKMRLEVKQVDLEEVVRGAIESVQLAADAKHLRLSAKLELPPQAVMGDPERLQQVVWNLLINAIKFTPPFGWVEVTLREVDGQAELVVRDSGEGIGPELLPYIFERFTQGAPTLGTQGGLGLGLAIVRSLTELHGGTVEAHSDGKGRGATFRIRLPMAEKQRPMALDGTTGL